MFRALWIQSDWRILTRLFYEDPEPSNTHTNKHRKHTQILQTNTNIANKHKYRKHTQISQTYTKNEISQPHIKLYVSQIDHRNNKLNIARHMNIQDIHKNDILQTH